MVETIKARAWARMVARTKKATRESRKAGSLLQLGSSHVFDGLVPQQLPDIATNEKQLAWQHGKRTTMLQNEYDRWQNVTIELGSRPECRNHNRQFSTEQEDGTHLKSEWRAHRGARWPRRKAGMGGFSRWTTAEA